MNKQEIIEALLKLPPKFIAHSKEESDEYIRSHRDEDILILIKKNSIEHK